MTATLNPVEVEADALRLMRPMEVAHALGVSRSYVYAAIEAGRLPAVYLGNGSRPVTRVDPRDLEAFVESRRQSPTLLAA